jgi:hypothetical protein
MRRELKNITENKKPRSDAFASVVRSFGEANNRFQALAVESVGRAIVSQSQIAGKAYENYISEISKLGRMFFVGYGTFTSRPQELPHANLNQRKAADRQQAASPEARVNPKHARQRTAAQRLSSKRKTGTVAKSQAGSKKSVKAKRKAASVRPSKG